MSDAAASRGARSFADDIRGRTDQQLVALVLSRPDLARPTPSDLTSLAARATTRASVQRAVEALDLAHLQVLEAVVVAEDPSSSGSVAALMGAEVGGLVDDLWRLGLVWQAGERVAAVRTVPEVLGPHPAGLGPSSAELGAPAVTAAQVRERLTEAPESARAALERLVWGPPVGVVNRDAPGSDGVRWLLAHGFLHVVVPSATERARGDGETRVVLPREVALVLREGTLFRSPALEPPAPETTDLGDDRVDAAAGGEAGELLALVEEAIEQWGPAPPRVLRSGGLAVRDLRRLAEALEVEQPRAAFLVELMLAAGLVADDGEVVPVWAPTPAADDWLAASAADRWVSLASAWLGSPRAAHLVGMRLAGSSTAVNALAPDVHWPPVRAMRTDILAALADLPAGAAESRDSLLARLRWRRPLRNAARTADVLTAVLREAAWLGMTGRDALSGPGRALVAVGPKAAAEAIAGLLPPTVDHILVQADLTAIAPGPLTGSLAGLMRTAADVESRGGATVYRFTPGSVRRALDTGWTADELLEALRSGSRTGLPQPLEYLVRDVARRHGQTRVGRATAYVRSDDESLLEGLLAERALRALQLRRIAPTVLVSMAEAEVLLEQMRDAGYSPVQERRDGSVVVDVAARRRAAPRRAVAPARTVSVDEGYASSLVRGLRAAEESARLLESEAERALAAADPAVTLNALREAAAEQHPVWIGYVDLMGQTDRYLFYPTRVADGRAWGRVGDSTVERGFAVSRITAVSDLAG